MAHKLGLVSISFRGLKPREILAAVKAAGLSCVEWGSDVHAPKDDERAIMDIAAMQRELGIECCSYGTYFRLGETPLSELDGYIKAAKLLGTNVLRLWCGTKNSEDYTADERDKLFSVCREAASIAEANGVLLCMECHNSTYTNRIDGALELMRCVDSPAFRMYWQPNQLRSIEENITYARKIGPYTYHAHVFNWSGKEKYPLSDAVDIWRVYLDALGGERTLLLEFMPDGRIESLAGEADALRAIADK
ncbi:MAG: sugar phosphate isomerase/epimerase [Clostridia bacterium]|nr:sugar phosphate isomerase/epimerase [Clostridia bacterium]